MLDSQWPRVLPKDQSLQPFSPCTWQAGGWQGCLLLVKTQTASVSKTFSSLLALFPSHPSPFSSRVAYKELYFAKKVSYVHTYLFCPFWSAEAFRSMFDSPLVQKTSLLLDCCKNCLKSDLRKRINPECLMPIMCWNWIGRAQFIFQSVK